jgi:hypothetical protein
LALEGKQRTGCARARRQHTRGVMGHPLPASFSQTTKHTGGVACYVCVCRKNGCSEGLGATLLILALGWRSAGAQLALGRPPPFALSWLAGDLAGAQVAPPPSCLIFLNKKAHRWGCALCMRAPNEWVFRGRGCVLEHKLPLSAHLKSRLVTPRALMLPRTRRRCLACAFVVPLSRLPRDFVVFTKTVFLLGPK